MEISKASKKKSTAEKIAQIVFTVCASFTILAVLSIMIYMIARPYSESNKLKRTVKTAE